MDTNFDGVLFSESRPANAKPIRETQVTLDNKLFGGTQLQNLDHVKAALAKQVKEAGGNALIAFEYGQKTPSFFRTLLSVDNIAWWGKGVIAKVAK